MDRQDRSGRPLEERVAQLFRDAGCEARTRVNVVGARGVDNVDVLVEFASLGIPETWAVECKDEAKAVSRGDVQLFHKKVENLGASRGVFVSTAGYQRGCVAVAERTNIHLSGFEDLAASMESRIIQLRLERCLLRLILLNDRLRATTRVDKGRARGHVVSVALPTGPGSDQYLERIGKLFYIKGRVTDALAGKWVYRVPRAHEDPETEATHYKVVSTQRQFCDEAERLLDESEQWATRLVPPG